MLPVIVPMVHWNVLGMFAVRLILVDDPLQMEMAETLVTTGSGLMIRVTVKILPRHPRELTP